MERKLVLTSIIVILLTSLLGVTFRVEKVKASGTIYIRADGSIDPPTSPIEWNGHIYTLTDNITTGAYGIIIERDNIEIDGANNTIHGAGGMGGIYLSNINNITIKNVEIQEFWYGIWLKNSSNNSIHNNRLTVNRGSGIYLSTSTYNNISENNITNNGVTGFKLAESSFNSIYKNTISVSGSYGLQLASSPSNNISQNNISNNIYTAIVTYGSLNNIISLNTIANNWAGIDVSSNNTISGNNITNNSDFGIDIEGANNILRNNTMTGNSLNFGGGYMGHFNDVDISNSVDSKPIYYWVGKHNMNVPLNAGYVALIKCSNITVQNLILRKNVQGLYLAYTENSTIVNNYIRGNKFGIYLRSSSNNYISENNIDTNQAYGIWHKISSNNNMFGNNMTNNHYGLNIDSSSYNTICENYITNNDFGIWFFMSAMNNTLFHNNFIDNTIQVKFYFSNYVNFWDNGVEGNYWSNYNNISSDDDGIGDIPYVLNGNNMDQNPLMGMFSSFNATSTHQIHTISNSSIADVFFNGTAIGYKVVGENGTTGFSRIYIPTDLMNGNYRIFVNGTEVLYTLLPVSNSTHSYLYFTYDHSTKEIIIVPEFPSLIILPLFMIATLIAVLVYRRKLGRMHACT